MEIGALNILEVVWSSSLKRNCSVVYGTRGKDSCLSSIRMFTGNPLVIPPKDVCMGIFVSISCLIKLLTTSSLTEKKEDYTPSVTANEGTIAGTKDSVVVESASKDNTVAFTNTRNGVIPTGVLLTVAPFAAIMAIGAVGILVMVGKKRKRAE